MNKEHIFVSVPINLDGAKDLENQRVEITPNVQLLKERRKRSVYKKVFLFSVLIGFIVFMADDEGGCRKFFNADESTAGFTRPDNWDELSPEEKSAIELKLMSSHGYHGEEHHWGHNTGGWHSHDHHGEENQWHNHDGNWHHHEGGWSPHDHSHDGDWHHHEGGWNPHGHHSHSHDGDWHHHDHPHGHHMFGSWHHDSHSHDQNPPDSHSHDQPPSLPEELNLEDELPTIDSNNNVIEEDASLSHDEEAVELQEVVNSKDEADSEVEQTTEEETEAMDVPSLEGLDLATREEKEEFDGSN